MSRETPELLIVGVSARAAAFSAIRAGLRVAAADLFADRDLAAVAEVTAITDWPQGIERWAAVFPGDVPLIYVGGLENEPELIDRLAESRSVAGIFGEPLRSVRTSESLAEIVRAAGLPFPRIARPDQADRDTRWLVKLRRSAAGRAVRRRNGEPLDRGEYLQEFIEGRPGSAAYLASGRDVELLGVTELLLPDESPLSVEAPFTYIGSITADIVDAGELKRLGRSLASVGLRGLFGVDFLQTETSEGPRLVPIEVNPRYAAGMEVLELRSGRSFVAGDLRAFDVGPSPHPGPRTSSLDPATRSGLETANRFCFGKLIVYAPRSLRVGALPVATPADLLDPNCPSPIADVPAEGAIVPACAPICTVFATGSDHTDCLALLKRREQEVLSRCEPACSDTGSAV